MRLARSFVGLLIIAIALTSCGPSDQDVKDVITAREESKLSSKGKVLDVRVLMMFESIDSGERSLYFVKFEYDVEYFSNLKKEKRTLEDWDYFVKNNDGQWVLWESVRRRRHSVYFDR